MNFLYNLNKIQNSNDFLKENVQIDKIKKLDLHGSSLVEANERVKNYIINYVRSK